MRRYAPMLSLLMLISLPAPSAAAAKTSTKPSAPTVNSITSSPAKNGKVNLTVVITLGADSGGAAITQTRISAGGKSCTAKNTKTSCTIKGIKSEKAVAVTAKSKNKKGFGSSSAAVTYISNGNTWTLGTSGDATKTALPITTRPTYPVPVVAVPTVQCANVAADLATQASAYGLTSAEATSALGGTCFTGNYLATMNQMLATAAIAKFPGLTGRISSSTSSLSYISYYVSTIESGLEKIPGSLDKWNDPLMQSFLVNGFPADKSTFARAVRNDERYNFTNRANVEARYIAYSILCDFGFTAECIKKISYQQTYDRLGPLIP